MIQKWMVDGGPTADQLNGTITADPAATLSFERPAVTTSPAASPYAGVADPGMGGGGFNGGTGGQAIPDTYGGAPGAGGAGPQSAPVQSPDQWLAGDSTFQGQQGQYNNQLKAFLDRLNQQKSDYGQDFTTATNAFNKNRDLNLRSLGEDWTSRGMANSGLFNQARDLANSQYGDQWNGMQTANTRAQNNFTQQGNDRQSEINQAIENARQQALGRMSSNQMF